MKEPWRVPAAAAEGRVLCGVALGVAREVGVDPLIVRGAFVLLAVAGGWGAVLYALAWGIMSIAGQPRDQAARRGRTSGEGAFGFALVTAGLLFGIRALGLGFVDAVVWPTALVVVGGLIAYQRGAIEREGEDALARLVAGALLVGGGLFVLLLSNLDLRAARDTVLASVAIVGGISVVVAPWILRLVRTLGDERRDRIRVEERSALAAHLHDSVLQTLTLIQRNAADPTVTVGLARQQERELRDWLYRDEREPGRFADRIRAICAEVEHRHGVRIEVVVVGDRDVDAAAEALLGATREATVNAAKHAEVDRVDVFAEAGPDDIAVYVRDQGRGYEPATVAEDRRGVRDSIVGRLERVGGTVLVTTAPGQGTEVELHLCRATPARETP